MAATIPDILNQLNRQGFFNYIIPFLLIFAIVYAILEKTGLFRSSDPTSKNNKAVSVIIALAVGLLALRFDEVPMFFANLFPKFGIGLSIFLVLLIFLGFFYKPGRDGEWPKAMTWIGWLLGIGIVVWALLNWGRWFGGDYDVGQWFREYFWTLVILAGLVGLVIAMTRSTENDSSSASRPPKEGKQEGN